MTANGGSPSFLVTGDEIERVEFEDGGWIDIARCVTAMQRARWSKEATVIRTKLVGAGKKAKQESEMDFDNEKFLEAFLRDIVKGWSSDAPLDVTKLSETAVTRIQDVFNGLNPSIGDDEEENGLGE